MSCIYKLLVNNDYSKCLKRYCGHGGEASVELGECTCMYYC